MISVLLYSQNPLLHALIGAIGALIIYFMYLGFAFIIELLKGRKNKNEDVEMTNLNNEMLIETTLSTNEIESEEREIMYCKYCGKQIDDDSSFCKYCGKAINNSSFTNTISTKIISFKWLVILSVWIILNIALWYATAHRSYRSEERTFFPFFIIYSIALPLFAGFLYNRFKRFFDKYPLIKDIIITICFAFLILNIIIETY
jgi:predicted nucleic acid-binding Zn ribbon protein